MKKKILFILHLPPPIHGAAIVGQNIKESEKINDIFECKYINLSASQNIDEVGNLNFKKIIFQLSNYYDIFRTIIKEQPDLCYLTPSSWDWGFYRDFILVLLLKVFRKKIVVHFHNKAKTAWANKIVNKFLYKFFFKNLKVIILAKELYPEKEPYVKRENVYFCANGIAISKTRLTPLHKNNESTTFLFLSNMMEEKGVYVLIEACKLLKDNGYKFHVNFVGNWADISKTEFNNKVNSLDINNYISAFGAKYGDDKKEFFESSNIFVFPTFYHGECFPLVILESMEYKLPIIATFEGGIPSIITDKENGLLIPQRNVIELANAMQFMIENPKKAEEMGNAGYERLKDQYTLSSFEDRFISIINDILKDD